MEALVHAQATLHSYQVCGVISDQEDAPALAKARGFGIPTHALKALVGEKRDAYGLRLIQCIESFQPDLIVLAGFMRILAASVIQKFKGRIINIHPSLLPSFPGLDAQKQALDHGVRVSGCTVHYVDEGCDTGPIILQTAVAVLPHDDVSHLSARILVEEHKLLPKAVDLIAQNKVKLHDNKKVTFSEGVK